MDDNTAYTVRIALRHAGYPNSWTNEECIEFTVWPEEPYAPALGVFDTRTDVFYPNHGACTEHEQDKICATIAKALLDVGV